MTTEGAWRTTVSSCSRPLGNRLRVCSTGQGGTCSEGKPGKLVEVKPTDADRKLLDKAAQEEVLKRWAKRCGADCVKLWNDSAGKVLGMTASGS